MLGRPDDFGLGELAAKAVFPSDAEIARNLRVMDEIAPLPGRRDLPYRYGKMVHGPIRGYTPWYVVDVSVPTRPHITGRAYATEMELVTDLEALTTSELRAYLNGTPEQKAELRREKKRVAAERERQEARRTRGSQPFVVMVNPKTLELVQMHKHGDSFRMALFGRPDKCIGDAWIAEDGSYPAKDWGDGKFIRIHSAQGECSGYPSRTDRPAHADFRELHGVNKDYLGQGYGALLYAGAAIGVLREQGGHQGVGVYSISGTDSRSRSAEGMWEKLVASGLAKTTEYTTEEESDPETDEIEHCEEISDREVTVRRYGRRQDYYITDDQVCGTVTAEIPGSGQSEVTEEITYLDGEKMLKQPFVLWAGDDSHVGAAPVDLVTRVKVHDRAAAERLGTYIRDRFGPEAALAFLQREDVAKLCGQKCLPGIAGPETPAGLPPVSADTQALMKEFEKLSEKKSDLEGTGTRSPRTRRAATGLSGPDVGEIGEMGARPRRVATVDPEDAVYERRHDLMVERTGLWKEQSKWAFREGAKARAKEREIAERLDAIEAELATLPKHARVLRGPLTRGSASAILFLALGGVLLGGLAYLFFRRKTSRWPGWSAPLDTSLTCDGTQAASPPIVCSGWADPRDYRGGVHEGVDFFVPTGTPVLAVAAGTVHNVFVAPDGNAGLMIELDHAGGLRSRYLHLSQANVVAGQNVARGDTIAWSGDTGSAAGQPQLHFDVRAMTQDAIDAYVAHFGTPDSGFPEHEDGWAVPAEPLAPWSIADVVLANDAQRGVFVVTA